MMYLSSFPLITTLHASRNNTATTERVTNSVAIRSKSTAANDSQQREDNTIQQSNTEKDDKPSPLRSQSSLTINDEQNE